MKYLINTGKIQCQTTDSDDILFTRTHAPRQIIVQTNGYIGFLLWLQDGEKQTRKENQHPDD